MSDSAYTNSKRKKEDVTDMPYSVMLDAGHGGTQLRK